jgi:predicted Zn-dependent protease with MMP-like domain
VVRLVHKHAKSPARGQGEGYRSAAMEPIPQERFEELVGRALDELPDALWDRFDNVAVVVEDEHPDEPDLLGIYEGIPLTERADYFGVLPDRIAIFRLPLCDMCEDEDDLVEEVKITVVHELAHHMGIDDDHLHELGWG